MYTLSEFRSSRIWCRSIGSVIRDMGLEGVSGYVYWDRYYIETTGGNLLLPLHGRDERFAPNTPQNLSDFEVLLCEFANDSL